jgi:cytochrome P450
MQNTHQAELVAELWQEARQWKGQCLCLEETLRLERPIPLNRRGAHEPFQPAIFTGKLDCSFQQQSKLKRL